ncbi:DUF998 domain-containing protein [Micromonospora sp. URMC 103]
MGAYSLLLAAPVYLSANVIAGLAWRRPPFSWATNNISDLGNVTCGLWDTTRPRQVCSPWHTTMNVGMVATGLLIALGLLLARRALGRGVAARATTVLVLAGAGGHVLAGLYPADVNEDNHFLAALLIFFLGNAGLLIAGLAGRSPLFAPMRGVSITLGLIGVTGTALFLAGIDLGFGVGGMERVAVFPMLVWAFVVGLGALRPPLPAARTAETLASPTAHRPDHKIDSRPGHYEA